MPLYQYDPTIQVLVVHGVPATGFAPGTFIEVERDEDSVMLATGTDGISARTRNANKAGKITITLMQSSPFNDHLSNRVQLDELTGTGVAPTFMKDPSGRTTALAPNSWITKPAPIAQAKEHGDRTWVIQTDRLEMFVGGNNPVGG